MKDKYSNLVANKLVNAFLKNKIINPISSKYTKKPTQPTQTTNCNTTNTTTHRQNQKTKKK